MSHSKKQSDHLDDELISIDSTEVTASDSQPINNGDDHIISESEVEEGQPQNSSSEDLFNRGGEENGLVDSSNSKEENMLVQPDEEQNYDHTKVIKIDQSIQPTYSSVDLGKKLDDDNFQVVQNHVSSESMTSAEASSLQSQPNSLKIAQEKIIELEVELEKTRIKNQELADAGKSFQTRCDELSAQLKNTGSDLEHRAKGLEEEKNILVESLNKKSQDMKSLKIEKSQLDEKFHIDFRKVRVRERELENRLELVKMENTTLVSSKDDIILSLKRQLDNISNELEGFKMKGAELGKDIEDKKDVLRRTVRALRLALSMLEGEVESNHQELKKVD